MSVILKELVVSLTVKLSVPAFWELIVNVAWPFTAWKFPGEEEPLTVKDESFEVCVTVIFSVEETVFLLQSRIIRENVAEEPVFAETGEVG